MRLSFLFFRETGLMLRNGGQSQDVSHGCRPSPRNFPAVHGPAHVPADRDRDRCAERSGGGDLAKIGAVAKRDVDSDRKAGSLRDGWGCEILAGDFLEGVPAGCARLPAEAHPA
jgi:hypothetical protein